MVGANPKFNRPIAEAFRNNNKRRRVLKQMRKKNMKAKPVRIPNPELMTKHILRKRNSNPRANITLSGKKKNKILKKIRLAQRDKSKMEIGKEIKFKRRNNNSKKKLAVSAVSSDVEMQDS